MYFSALHMPHFCPTEKISLEEFQVKFGPLVDFNLASTNCFDHSAVFSVPLFRNSCVN